MIFIMKARIPGASQGDMMQKLQQMQEDIARVQDEVENTEFSASVGGGAVEITVNGKHEALGVKLQQEIVDPDDIEMLQDLIIAAFNEGIRKASEAMEKGMEQAKGGLSIPGLM
jgi:nucleoid-associated protein EbfC